ncbi:MAG: hypothetical protein Q4Q20_02245 [Methanocorpusculum sp.]|nr:hypothetical protein [Methanocorpusculum sp.]
MNKKSGEETAGPSAKEEVKKRTVKKAAGDTEKKTGKAVSKRASEKGAGKTKKDTEPGVSPEKTEGKAKSAKTNRTKEADTKETGAKDKVPKTASGKTVKGDKQSGTDAGYKKVPDAFISDLNDLAKIFEVNPGVIDPIRDVFECHLADPLDRKTFPRMVNAVSMLLGPAPAMVLMTGCHVNSVSFFEDLLGAVKDNDSAKTAVWIIQQLTSIYGNRVQKAYSLSSGTMDEDWHTIDINTFRREGPAPLWLIDLRLSQYSGVETQLKMTPDSAYQLVEILMTELVDNIPAEQIDPDLVGRCREHCKEFYEKFYGKEKTKNEDEHPAGYA